VIGRRFQLDRDPFRVVGVVPAGFQVLASTDVWTITTTAFMRNPAAVGHYIRAVGRLAPGVTLARAQADMTAVADELAQERPDRNKDHGILLEPLQDGLVGADLRLTAKVLLGVVAFVLLTCCANIANLVLAPTSGRARELAVRFGARRGRTPPGSAADDREPRAVGDGRGARRRAWRRDPRRCPIARSAGRAPDLCDAGVRCPCPCVLRCGGVRSRARLWRLSGVAGRSPGAPTGDERRRPHVHRGRTIDISQRAGAESGGGGRGAALRRRPPAAFAECADAC
jgi:hypothetical protein